MHFSSATNAPPGLIGVDWGTSSCRAYRMDAAGQILEVVNTDKGILQIEGEAFADTLDGMIGAWRRPGLPVILSGMIGSRQGWIETPYVDLPASFDEIAQALLQHPDDDDVYLVPGLVQGRDGNAPDVIRGEETQIIGAVGAPSDHQLLVMPGTHSKWVMIEDRVITWFATFITGELFAVLKDHSILGRLITGHDGGMHNDAFLQGLHGAKTLDGGLMRHLFSARTLGLFDRLPPNAIAPYLSGLLIGHELEDALDHLKRSSAMPPLTIIGDPALVRRYMTAFEETAIKARSAGEHMAAHGQYQLARAAGLLSPSNGTSA